MQACTATPPPGQDINEYMLRLKDILKNLVSSLDKQPALERLDLMINSINEVIRNNPVT